MKNFLENPYRYIYAPRSMAEAYRDADYASPLTYYERPYKARVFVFILLIVIALLLWSAST